jgi:hypothetical protein
VLHHDFGHPLQESGGGLEGHHDDHRQPVEHVVNGGSREGPSKGFFVADLDLELWNVIIF